MDKSVQLQKLKEIILSYLVEEIKNMKGDKSSLW